jgi:hypothetical protein
MPASKMEGVGHWVGYEGGVRLMNASFVLSGSSPFDVKFLFL